MICRKCKHLIDPSETHECPSEEYLLTINALIDAAEQAEEIFSEDELEDYIREKALDSTSPQG